MPQITLAVQMVCAWTERCDVTVLISVETNRTKQHAQVADYVCISCHDHFTLITLLNSNPCYYMYHVLYSLLIIYFFYIAEELGIVDDDSALIYGLAFGLGSVVVISIIVGVLVYRHYRWKRFLNEPIPKDHYQNASSNYPVTKKYYKRAYQSYTYNSIDSQIPSRMSNDFETDDDLDAGSRPMTPSSSVSKKNNLTVPVAKSGKVNLRANTGASNC